MKIKITAKDLLLRGESIDMTITETGSGLIVSAGDSDADIEFRCVGGDVQVLRVPHNRDEPSTIISRYIYA
jgi:hypothetical protein